MKRKKSLQSNAAGDAISFGTTELSLVESFDLWRMADRDRIIAAISIVRAYRNSGMTLLMEADYEYDAFGNRTEKIVDADGAGGGAAVTTKFAIDQWNPAKPSPIGTENADVWGDAVGGSSLTTRYVRGDVVDQLLARIDGSTARWYVTDHLGSIRKVLDNSGVVKDAITYDAWGNILTETDANERGRYAWTSREIDVETALQYNRARYYDATTGRWIAQDPLGFDAGDSNLYRYVKNAPATSKDPSGLQDRPRLERDWEAELRALSNQRLSDYYKVRVRFASCEFSREEMEAIRNVALKAADSVHYALRALEDDWQGITERHSKFENMPGQFAESRTWRFINDNRDSFLRRLKAAERFLRSPDNVIDFSNRPKETHKDRNPLYTVTYGIGIEFRGSIYFRSHYYELDANLKVFWMIHEYGRYILFLGDQSTNKKKEWGFRDPSSVQGWDDCIQWLNEKRN